MTGSDAGEGNGNGSDDAALAPDDALLLDVMLGKLAVYLRMCGYDAAYAGDRGLEADDRLLEIAAAEDRTLLTRDVELAERAADAVLLTEHEVADQLSELRDVGVVLAIADRPSRCGRCNGPLDPVADADGTPVYAPDPAAIDCWRCRSCGQVFWKGSHHDRVAEIVDGGDT